MAFKIPKEMDVERRIREFLTQRGLSRPVQPSDDMPSLSELEGDMTPDSAEALHIGACRWAEYLEFEVRMAQVRKMHASDDLEMLKLRIKQVQGGKMSEADVQEWADCKRRILTTTAMYLALEALLKKTMRIKEAASRSLTKQLGIGGAR